MGTAGSSLQGVGCLVGLVLSLGVKIPRISIKKQSGNKIGQVFDTYLSRGLSFLK